MKKVLISALIILVSLQVQAQVAMGKWRTHLAYNSVTQIAQSGSKIYAVSEGSLFSVSKDDGDMEFYSKMSGLNDAGISRIDFDETNNQLLIIYQNGNIDIMHDAGVNNIPDLHNKQMSSSKGINHVFFNGEFAYLSCDFGIIRINMTKKEIADTYIIGPNASELKILSTTIFNNKIYAVNGSAIYTADISNPNLVNYEFWKTISGLPGSGSFQAIYTFQGKLLVLRNGKLYYQLEDNTWSPLMSSVTITTCNISKDKIIAGDGTTNIYVLNSGFELTVQSLINSPDIEYDNVKDTYWMAAASQGVISFKLISGSDPEITWFKPEGPAVNIPWSLTFAGEKLFMVNGGRWDVQYNRNGLVMIYENGKWTNIESIKDIYPITQHAVLDFVNVAVDPADNKHFYVTSYGTGLYEFKDDKFLEQGGWHNQLNSTLFTIVPSNPYLYIRLDGAVFDKNGNLFLSNMSTSGAIKIRKKTGEWKQLNYPNSAKPTLGKIVISNINPNQKWVPSVRFTPGIFIWDDNGTLPDETGDNQSDDKNIFLSKFPDSDNLGSYITPSYFYCLEQDNNGVFWAGTDIGPLLFYNPSKAFDENYTCSRVKIPRNDGTGLADYLLQNEKIRAIAIDGANRKWLGTETSGLYLMSENGQETIHHFTTTNSPLLSNNIMSLAINPVTGEVMVGTSNGLVSFQSDAADGKTDFSNVYTYPNPVKENYNGIITITGLIANTQVKITDLNGNLIYQTISNGSIATWDGKDIHGKKVSTGIYMAICSNEDGTQSITTKIMIIN